MSFFEKYGRPTPMQKNSYIFTPLKISHFSLIEFWTLETLHFKGLKKTAKCFVNTAVLKMTAPPTGDLLLYKE